MNKRQREEKNLKWRIRIIFNCTKLIEDLFLGILSASYFFAPFFIPFSYLRRRFLSSVIWPPSLSRSRRAVTQIPCAGSSCPLLGRTASPISKDLLSCSPQNGDFRQVKYFNRLVGHFIRFHLENLMYLRFPRDAHKGRTKCKSKAIRNLFSNRLNLFAQLDHGYRSSDGISPPAQRRRCDKLR